MTLTAVKPETTRGFDWKYDFLGQEWRPLSTVYIDDRTDAQTHKHDIKIGADPDNLVRKLNEDGEKRIIKRRVDSELSISLITTMVALLIDQHFLTLITSIIVVVKN